MGARSAVALSVALWLGLALGTRLPAAWAPGAMLLGVLLVAWPDPRAGAPLPRLDALVAASLGLVLLGMCRGSAHRAHQSALEQAIPPAGLTARGLARVVEPPRREGQSPSAAVELIASDVPLPRGVRARLRLPDASPAEWCDTLEVTVELERTSPARNPGGFDARAAARAADLHAHGRAFVARTRPERSLLSMPVRFLMRVRRGAEEALARALTPGARELVVPLLFGDRAGMSTDTDAALRGSGLVHLLALSGLHVAWLAGVARGLAASAGGGPLARSVAGALAAAAYMVIAGPIPSLARAVVAECASALACATRRAVDPLQSLALAPLLLFAVEPAWALDLGFQLSCAATLGFVAIGGPWSTRLAGEVRLPRWLEALVGNLLLTIAAQLAALPLLLARFHALPWTSIAGNLVAVPVSEWLLAAAALGAALEAVLPGARSHRARGVRAARGGASRHHGDARSMARRAARHWCLPLAGGVRGARRGRARALDAGAARAARAHAGLRWRAALRALASARSGSRACARSPRRRFTASWPLVVDRADVGQGDAIAIADAHGWWLVTRGRARRAGTRGGRGAAVLSLGRRAPAGSCRTHAR
jgi:ComEC/Rec2-related protein